jgi:hypothetical protein
MPRLWVFGDSFSATNDRPALEKWRLDYIKWKGYVAAAPSIHPNGKTYEIVNHMEPQIINEDLLEMGAK